MQKVLRNSSAKEQNSWHPERRGWTKTLAGFGVIALFMQACAVCAQSAQPAPSANIFIEQERRDAERASQQRAQQERNADVKLPAAPQAPVGLLPTEESPCFKIDLVTLNAGRDAGPQDLLDAVGQTTSGVSCPSVRNSFFAESQPLFFQRSASWGWFLMGSRYFFVLRCTRFSTKADTHAGMFPARCGQSCWRWF